MSDVDVALDDKIPKVAESPMVNELSDEASDEFGNFSDASYEDEIVDKDTIDTYLQEIFNDVQRPDNTKQDEVKHDLAELIQGERTSVIYEQLVVLRSVLQPFFWEKSQLRANLLHILKIQNDDNDEHYDEDGGPLDDTLYLRLINYNTAEFNPSIRILNDVFKYKYIPPLTHRSLMSELEKEQEKEMPQLINTNIYTLKTDSAVSELSQYHDKICNAIDLLYVKMKVLEKRQQDLIRDKTTFENVVANLTSHTQRLHRDEVAVYNKKKKNRFSWISR